MDKLVGLIEKAPHTRDYNDDDVIDRLSSRYTVVILVCFSFLISMNQYVRNPITCWTPNHFSGVQSKYATSLCWVKNTYYLPWNETILREHVNHRKQHIPYYQWVPFILVAQAFFFYMPSIIWHSLNSRAGVDADNILAVASTFTMTDKVETSDRTMKMLIQQIHRFLKSHVDAGYHRTHSCLAKCRKCGKRFGSYLVVIFLTSKFFYILNAIGQIFILSYLLSTDYSSFGFQLLRKLVRNEDWTESFYVAFPRVTICDFRVRGQDAVNPHPYTIQCVLPVNMYNEKIYAFLWFWIWMVAVLSIVSFLIWLLRSLVAWDRISFVRNHIVDATSAVEKISKEKKEKNINGDLNRDPKEITKKKIFSYINKNPLNRRSAYDIQTSQINSFDSDLKKFCNDYLKQDGELLLRLIAHNTDHMTTTDIIYELWKNWIELKNNSKNKNYKKSHDFI